MTNQQHGNQQPDARRKNAQKKLARINSNYSANPVKWAIGIGAAVLAIAVVFCILFATGVISVDPSSVSSDAVAALPAGGENAQAATD